MKKSENDSNLFTFHASFLNFLLVCFKENWFKNCYLAITEMHAIGTIRSKQDIKGSKILLKAALLVLIPNIGEN